MTVKELRDALDEAIKRYGPDREVKYLDDCFSDYEVCGVYLHHGSIYIGHGEELYSLDPEY